MTMIFDHNNNSDLKLGSFLHGKTIESLNNPTNYPPINLVVTPAGTLENNGGDRGA